MYLVLKFVYVVEMKLCEDILKLCVFLDKIIEICVEVVSVCRVYD